VSAARQQAHERRLEAVVQEVRRHVSLQVIDGGQRQPPRRREAFRRRHPDQQRTDQPGTLRHRDQLGVVERRVRFLQREVHDRIDVLEVVT
jgi:hypothetical protein